MLFSKKKNAANPGDLPEHLALRVNNVSKNFKKFAALSNVSFELPKGQCLGIVGFNGAGKSTLLQIIAKTIQASEGSVQTRGRVVAMLELGTGFNPEYTGLENLYMSAAIHGVPSEVVDARLPEIEAFAEIGDFLRKPVKTYSSGMRLRLAFSLYTQIDPDIMIVDEALAVGDAYFSHKCAQLIKRFRADGKTFLVVSHSPLHITSLCDRAILLDHGTIIRDGNPPDILDYYGAMVAQREREEEIRQIEKESGRVVTRSGNGKAKIIRFELTDTDDQPRRKFVSGTPACISCVLESAVALEQPTIGFMIRDRFGNEIFGTNTYHLEKDAGTLEANSQLEVNFQTTLNLGPGEYSITLAAHKGADHMEDSYDWFDRLIVFQVLPAEGPLFSGVAALPATAKVSREIRPLNRHYPIGTEIDFSDSGNAHRFLANGWDKPEASFTWSIESDAILELANSKFPKRATLELTGRPFTCPAIKSQTIEIHLNGRKIGSQKLGGPSTLRFDLADLPPSGTLQIHLRLPDAASPASQNLSGDERTLGIALSSARLLAHSE